MVVQRIYKTTVFLKIWCPREWLTVTHQITQSSIIINSHTFYIILYYNSFFNTIPISMSPYSSLVSILNNDLSGTFSIINTLNPSQMINIHNIHTRFFFFTENTEYMYMYICCCIGYICLPPVPSWHPSKTSEHSPGYHPPLLCPHRFMASINVDLAVHVIPSSTESL